MILILHQAEAVVELEEAVAAEVVIHPVVEEEAEVVVAEGVEEAVVAVKTVKVFVETNRISLHLYRSFFCKS
jgi:hypothetical protein